MFANAFYLDAVQDALVVRPVTALARAVRRVDESGVDGAVEGTGRGRPSGSAARSPAPTGPACPGPSPPCYRRRVLLGLAAVAIVGVWP